NFNPNRFCACVECVFQQLLHHRSGPLHNFASSNLVGHSFRQYAYATHPWRFGASDLLTLASPSDDAWRIAQRATSWPTKKSTQIPNPIVAVITTAWNQGCPRQGRT